MRELERLAEYIGISVPTAWENCYDAAIERYEPNWLEQIDFDAVLDYYQYPQEFYRQRLHRELELLGRDSDLNRICWLMHYILIYGSKEDLRNIWTWSKTPFSEHGTPTTCVVALLAGQAFHAQLMTQCSYDEEQIAIHKKSVRACWTGQRDTYGIDGVSFNLMVWGAYYQRGYMVRLGRLNYEFGIKSKHDYAEQFGDDAAYIYLHIPPADNGLLDEEVELSVRMAQEKLDTYFPECAGKQKVFCVRTWLLGPQLREMLKPTSNIIKFQNRFNITDYYEGTASYVSAVFKISAPLNSVDFAALPEDTSLQKAVKERLLKGEPLQNGVGYFTLD